MEPYNYHESNKDPNELIGQTLFVYMYVTNAVVALIVGIFILPLLLKVYDCAAKKNDKFFRDSTRVQLFMVTPLASVHIGAVYIADMYYYIKISYKYFNLFLILKLLFEVLVLVILLIGVFYIVFKIVRCYHTGGEDCQTVLARISQTAVIVPLTLALILVMLSIFPTLLLLFAHLMNTFSLIVIHVALFYTETMAGVLFMDQLYTYKPVCTIGQCLCNSYQLACTSTRNRRHASYERVPEEDIELHVQTPKVETPQVLEKQEMPQVLQNQETPQKLQNQEMPQVLQNQETPQVIQNQETPQVIQNQETPQEETPQVLQKQEMPQVLQNQETPQVLQNQETPQVLQNQETPQVLQNQEMPQVLQNQETPQVLQNQKMPQVTQNQKSHR